MVTDQKNLFNFLLCVPKDLKCHFMSLGTKKDTLVPEVQKVLCHLSLRTIK
jgi:hypothetical protein